MHQPVKHGKCVAVVTHHSQTGSLRIHQHLPITLLKVKWIYEHVHVGPTSSRKVSDIHTSSITINRKRRLSVCLLVYILFIATHWAGRIRTKLIYSEFSGFHGCPHKKSSKIPIFGSKAFCPGVSPPLTKAEPAVSGA